MVTWKKEIQDRHMEGSTPYGQVFIRFNRESEVTGMYTLFGYTKKYMPEEKWMQDLEGAQLFLETICEKEKNTRKFISELRSKTTNLNAV
jgi:hypothetical protein